MPLFGVCLGQQAIVLEAGGEVVRRAASRCTAKRSLLDHDGDGPFAGLPNPLNIGRYHSLCTRNPPARFRVHAAIDGMAMAISDPEAKQVGVQFHPESVLTPERPAHPRQRPCRLRLELRSSEGADDLIKGPPGVIRGLDPNLCLRVTWATLLPQAPQLLFTSASGQRPVVRSGNSGEDEVDGRVQPHSRRRFEQHLAGLGVDERAASGCKDHGTARQQRGNDAPLRVPELGFAACAKDVPDRHPECSLYFSICIGERHL